ncbi:hypothetical protein SAMN04489740_2043 [Arthrobacter alpinus]|uniref:Uncharacterized protein n=1 Tax=Arthrobacter alpinus TaxID=656366 RepID=A0A1H5KJB2_9MICC|nr:hypothetical protein SAMN04489740_2043 [Arthrobacter alpinus]
MPCTRASVMCPTWGQLSKRIALTHSVAWRFNIDEPAILHGASHRAPSSEPTAERPSETKAFPQPSSAPLQDFCVRTAALTASRQYPTPGVVRR